MNKTFGLLLLCILILACNKHKPYLEEPNQSQNIDGKGYLKINFDTQFNGVTFALYNDFYNPLNQRIQFELLKFFLTDFYAKKTNGDSTLFLDAFMYNFQSGPTSLIVQIDTGNYTGLSYGFGVDSLRNHMDPTLYNTTHPLSYNLANTMHWGWATGYIFMKLEAKADTTGTGTGTLDQFLVYHPGDDTCFYMTPFLSKIFNITQNDTTTLTIRMDVAKFFTTPTDTLDLRIDNVTHFSDNPSLAIRICKNVANSFIIL